MGGRVVGGPGGRMVKERCMVRQRAETFRLRHVVVGGAGGGGWCVGGCPGIDDGLDLLRAIPSVSAMPICLDMFGRCLGDVWAMFG